MKAMILAAGRGERLRPFTDHTPKPLLPIAGKPLLVWHIEHLRAAGFQQLVINTGWLGEQLPALLGNGERLGVSIEWSMEGWPAYETAGGIATALPRLGPNPFVLVNGDIWTDYPFAQLRQALQGEQLAHLVLVDNPEHHPHGDFGLEQGRVSLQGNCLTYSGIAVCHPRLFADTPSQQPSRLAPLLQQAIRDGQVSGEHFCGRWIDVGTVERAEQAGRAAKAA